MRELQSGGRFFGLQLSEVPLQSNQKAAVCRTCCVRRVVVLDIRFPTLPVAELSRHQACVNAVAWAPHSSCHICTAGDDRQALIWDLSAMGPNPATDAGSLGMIFPLSSPSTALM